MRKQIAPEVRKQIPLIHRQGCVSYPYKEIKEKEGNYAKKLVFLDDKVWPQIELLLPKASEEFTKNYASDLKQIFNSMERFAEMITTMYFSKSLCP